VRDKLVCDSKWRVADDGVAIGRRLEFQQEVASANLTRHAVVDKICSDDIMPGRPQNTDDGAPTSRRLPDPTGQLLDSEQGLDGNSRRLVEIVTALGVCRTADYVPHWAALRR